MKKSLIALFILFSVSCNSSSSVESPAREVRLDRGNLTTAEVASVAVKVGVRNGFSASVKDPEHMEKLNNGVPAVHVWLKNGMDTAAILSTLIENDVIQVELYSSGIPDAVVMNRIVKELEKEFTTEKHNKKSLSTADGDDKP